MRFKKAVAMVLIAITLLINVTLITSLGKAPSSEGTEYTGASEHILTPSQSASETYASNSLKPLSDHNHINPVNSNKFNFNSPAKDLSSYKTEELLNLAAVDADSAELVIGLDRAQSGYVEVSDLIAENGGKVVNTVSIKEEIIALVAQVPAHLVTSFAAQLQSSNLVKYVEPNMKFETQHVPNDPDWNLQWGPKKIEADYAWDTTTGDPSVLVAVIDTGIDYDHPDLDANYVSLGYDWVNMDSDPMDDHGHGTHCAGIVAAELDNGIGIAGVAQVKVMAEKGLNAGGSGTEDDLANAIIHAVDQGADILSNSWGGPDSALIHDAMRYAYNSNVLIIAAAGNSATSNKMYPAAYDEVIAVTATDQMDDPAWFTNFGDWVDLAAPGVDIYSTVWDNGYVSMSGTSMSAPHVAGTAALIWSQFPGMSRNSAYAQLKFTADDLGDPGFDNYFGNGRINARKAVEWAPSDHDLLIDYWQRPRFVQPGDIVAYNVSVFNFGLNDESDITVQLLVDNNLTDSATISFLANGTAQTVTMIWNAALEAKYNVTVWVQPVPGETNTENNIMSMTVNVQPVKTALLMNNEPWNVPANENALTKYDIPYAVFNSADFGLVNLTQFSKVIVVSDQDQAFYNAMNTYRGWLEDYVKTGGMLEVHAADWGWHGGTWTGPLPGGLMWNRFSANYVTIVDPSHPVVNTPNLITDTELDNWNSAVHGFFTSYSPDSTIILKEDNTGQPAYLEFDYGAGAITATSQTIELGYIRGLSLILENSLLYSRVKYPHELSVTLNAPTYLTPNDSTTLNATVYNIGLDTETNVELQLLINGSIVQSAVIPELPSGWAFTITYDWIQPAKGAYNITAYAPPVPEEEFLFNNDITRFVTVASPLINPIEGQWANYIVNYYDAAGRVSGRDYWRLTYDHYVAPYKIYITLVITDRYGYNSTSWMIVNTMTRYVESGAWMGLWYMGWIETDIDVGSQVNILYGMTVVNGSRIVPVGIYPIDCWELPVWAGYQYFFWYDKVSGLWIGMDYYPTPSRVELRLTDTNIPIGTPYEHELAATVEAPTHLEPNDSAALTATAHNVGQNTETNVKITLLIDGAEVISQTIPTFLKGTSYTIDYLWTPKTEALYNITAYVQPVANEAFTVNNAATQLVRVRSVKGYVLFDQTHWADPIYTYSTWVNNLTDRGYIIDTLTLRPLTPAALQGYDVFVIPQAHDYYGSTEITTIQDFVQNGGGLLVIGDDSPYIYSDLTRFAGITWDYGGYWGYTNDITAHRVTEGVETAYFDSPGRVYVSLSAQGLIRDANKSTLLAVSEAKAGAVIGIADENTVIDWNIGFADNLRLANNMIDWLKSRAPFASFTYSPLDPYVGETVTFDGSASYDPDGTITQCVWNFGDGTIFNQTASSTNIDAAVTGPVISVKPSRTVVDPGDSFNIEIYISDVENLYGYQFRLLYNTAILTAVDMAPHLGTSDEPGFFFPKYMVWNHVIDDDPWGNGTGYVALAVTPPIGERNGLSGSGRLALIQFTADAVGHSALTFSNHKLTNPSAENIAHSVTDGNVWVGQEPPPEEPPEEPPVEPPAVTPMAVHVYAAGGTYRVSLTTIDNEGLDNTFVANVTVARTALDVVVQVGSIHFRGETAEFYILVSTLGKAIDANISAILYFQGSLYQNLSTSAEHVSKGLYRIPYMIPLEASAGTYALAVEARYFTLTGVSLGNFLVSPTLTGWNALLISINGTVGTIATDVGLVTVNLKTINATLVSVEGKTATIHSIVGMIQTNVGTINANINAINGTIVKINSSLGSVQQDISMINAKLVALDNTVATVQTDIGTIMTDITNIQLRVTSVNGTVATIQTSLGTIHGTILSLHNDEVATILTDVGVVRASIPKGWTESQQQNTNSLYILLVLVLIISIGTIILTFFRRKKS